MDYTIYAYIVFIKTKIFNKRIRYIEDICRRTYTRKGKSSAVIFIV